MTMIPAPKCPDCGGVCAWQRISPRHWEGSCYGACGGYPVLRAPKRSMSATVSTPRSLRHPRRTYVTPSGRPFYLGPRSGVPQQLRRHISPESRREWAQHPYAWSIVIGPPT